MLDAQTEYNAIKNLHKEITETEKPEIEKLKTLITRCSTFIDASDGTNFVAEIYCIRQHAYEINTENNIKALTIQTAKKLAKLYLKDSSVYLKCQSFFENFGSYNPLITYLSIAIKEYPQDYTLYYERGQCFLNDVYVQEDTLNEKGKMKNLDCSISDFKKSLALFDTFDSKEGPYSDICKGHIYQKIGEAYETKNGEISYDDEIISNYTLGIATDPNKTTYCLRYRLNQFMEYELEQKQDAILNIINISGDLRGLFNPPNPNDLERAIKTYLINPNYKKSVDALIQVLIELDCEHKDKIYLDAGEFDDSIIDKLIKIVKENKNIVNIAFDNLKETQQDSLNEILSERNNLTKKEEENIKILNQNNQALNSNDTKKKKVGDYIR